MAWLLVLLASAVLWTLLLSVLPRPPSPMRRRLERMWDHATGRVLHRDPPPPDPFEALRLQNRLGALAGEIRDIEGNPHVFAKMHRLVALRAAYDDLLDEACRLAGVPPTQGEARGDDLRWHEEQELAARGWSW
jgi:hypothetical protein